MPTGWIISPVRRALLAFWQGPTPFDPARFQGAGGASFFLMLLQTIVALALVCGLAYLLFRWVLPRLQGAAGRAGGMIRVVDRLGLDARKSLIVVEVAGRWLLVGTSEAGVQLVSELDATTAREAADELERLRPSFKDTTASAREALAERFARLVNREK